jgi:hypothetical protein
MQPVLQSLRSRLAPPYTFSPDLSLGDALVAVVAALVRILGGCTLFALLGGGIVLAWSSIANPFWRAGAVVLLALTFAASFAMLLILVSAAQKAITRRLEGRRM